jgi:hypothetical protein
MRRLAVLLLLGAVAGSVSAQPIAAGDPKPSPRWVRHVDRPDGLSIQTPARWSFKLDPVPKLVYPVIPFAVGSWDFPSGSDSNGCAPSRALKQIPASGVLLWLTEYPRPYPHGFHRQDFPARPKRFKLIHRYFGAYECVGDSYLIRFKDSGRFFQFQVVLGPKAEASIRKTAERVLDSLQVKRTS